MSFLKACLFAVIFPGWFRLQNQNKEFGKISPNVRLMEILRNFLPVARNDFFKQKKTYLKIPEILHCEKYATIREDAGQRNRYCGRFYTVLNFFVNLVATLDVLRYNFSKYCLFFRWFLANIPHMNYVSVARSSHRRCSLKKLFLKISQNLQENTIAGATFFNKVQRLKPTILLKNKL